MYKLSIKLLFYCLFILASFFLVNYFYEAYIAQDIKAVALKQFENSEDAFVSLRRWEIGKNATLWFCWFPCALIVGCIVFYSEIKMIVKNINEKLFN